eukprot:EG_transcript_47589
MGMEGQGWGGELHGPRGTLTPTTGVQRAATQRRGVLRPLPADAAGQLDVLHHDGDALRVDGTQVGVLEQPHEVRLRRLLQGQDGVGLEADVRLVVLHDLPHQPLERQLAD